VGTANTVCAQRAADAPSAVRISDLGAVVYDGVPDGLPGELPGLYNSLLSTLDYMVVYRRKEPTGACVLEEPRHVLLLRREGREIEILNRFFVCGPEEARRACRALFRAYPDLRRVALEVMVPPDELSLPWSFEERHAFMAIDLPASVDEYYRSLGKSTRRTVRGNRNRLQRAFPDLRTETIGTAGCDRALVERMIEWKRRRFKELGRMTYWDVDPRLVDRSVDLLRTCGRCRVTYISGSAAAIHFCMRAGDTVFAFAGAHDPAYDAYRLGFLTMYETVCDAIESGATRLNALWGTAGPKELLGARPVEATLVKVYRSLLWRQLHVLSVRASRHPRGAALMRLVVDRRRNLRPRVPD
jgi:hypothetical protein